MSFHFDNLLGSYSYNRVYSSKILSTYILKKILPDR